MRVLRSVTCVAALTATILCAGCTSDGGGRSSREARPAPSTESPLPASEARLAKALLTDEDVAADGWTAGKTTITDADEKTRIELDPDIAACEGKLDTLIQPLTTASVQLTNVAGSITVTEAVSTVEGRASDTAIEIRTALEACGETLTLIDGEKVTMSFEDRVVPEFGDSSFGFTMTADWPGLRTYTFEGTHVAVGDAYLTLVASAPYDQVQPQQLDDLAARAVDRLVAEYPAK